MSGARGSAARGKGTLSPLVLGYVLNPVALATFWLLRRWGVIAEAPLWAYLVILWGGAAMATAVEVWWRRRPSPWSRHGRIAAQVACVTTAIYVTGWGPALAIAYAFIAQENIASGGSRSWPVTTWWCGLGLVLGQLAISVGWAPSLLDAPFVHGLAVVNALILVFVVRMVGAVIAQKEQAEAEVRATGDRFHSLVQNSSDLTLVLDRRAIVTYASEASERLLGLRPDELIGKSARPLVHPSDLAAVREQLRADSRRRDVPRTIELRVRVADGSWRYFEAVVADLADRPSVGGLVVNARDITERKRAEAALEHQALHDSLTGLPNRTLFLDHLDRAIAQSARHTMLVPAVAFLDLDRFKLVNDGFGHDAGDELLATVAERLRTALRPTDTVARFGGDEFVLLCQGVPDGAAAEAVGRRILSCFEHPFTLGGVELRVSASVGIAVLDRVEDFDGGGELVRCADEAMYRAKGKGRGCVEVFDASAREAALVRIRTETALRAALRAGELRVHYQPIFDISSNRPVGVEALLRWQRADGTLVYPADFIDVAEDSGLIVPIGRWVLAEACRQVRRWNADRPAADALKLCVNLSARQLMEPGLVAMVRDALAGRAGDQAKLDLVLEVTETSVVGDPDAAAERLRELAALGAEFAIDDFGTGYSSLSYLRQFPLRIVKIDRAFVAGLGASVEDEAIVRAVVHLGRSLGLTVVAEGVEMPTQLARLAALGCHQAQGYLLGAPRPADELAEVLAPAADTAAAVSA